MALLQCDVERSGSKSKRPIPHLSRKSLEVPPRDTGHEFDSFEWPPGNAHFKLRALQMSRPPLVQIGEK
jgi:hypothetical protein